MTDLSAAPGTLSQAKVRWHGVQPLREEKIFTFEITPGHGAMWHGRSPMTREDAAKIIRKLRRYYPGLDEEGQS